MCFISQTGNQSNFLDPQFLSKCISPISYILLALIRPTSQPLYPHLLLCLFVARRHCYWCHNLPLYANMTLSSICRQNIHTVVTVRPIKNEIGGT